MDGENELSYLAGTVAAIQKQLGTLWTIRSGAGDPTGIVTPLYIGEEYLNTTGNHWYKSHGLAAANWTALN